MNGPSPVPGLTGIGLKPEHYAGLLATRPRLGFLEVHAENYMGAGGPPHRYLEAIAATYPLSFHGVGMSLGGTERLDPAHLTRWRKLVDRYAPTLVSEHVAWSRYGEAALNDLLPLPYTAESLGNLCAHVDQMQQALGRRILIENPSRYVEFRLSQMPEAEFLARAAERTGCGLLLDVNNAYVSARNLSADAGDYVAAIPADAVGEIHLAGHAVETLPGGREIRIDDHGSRTTAAVWELYRNTIERIGWRPTLIEWDTDVPSLEVLLDEARTADGIASLAAGRRITAIDDALAD